MRVLAFTICAALATGCAIKRDPIVPLRAQAPGCSRSISDSTLARLRSGFDSTAGSVHMLRAGQQRRPPGFREGSVTFEYIVLTDGRIDPCSIRIVNFTDEAFIDPGVDMLLESEFSKPDQPAYVRQWLRWEVRG